jgi:hypothetical protein
MLLDRGRVGKEAVDGNKGRNGGKEGQQRIIGDAGGDRHHPVLAEFLIGAPQDVLPSFGRDFGRRVRAAPAARFVGCMGRRMLLL